MKTKIFLLMIPLVLFFGIAFFSRQPSTAPAQQEVEAPISSAESCRPCHTEIYDQWKSSFHAQSIHTPTFRAMLTIFKYNTQGEHIEFCFKCHAPEVKVKGNSDQLAGQVLQGLPIRSEGITCTICHSIESVEDRPDPEVPVAFDFGRTPPFHKVMNTSVTQSAEMCGSCHDYNTPNFVHPEQPDTPCCDVNRDWKKTSFAQNDVTCQSCHMKDEMGVVELTVMDKIKNGLYQLVGLKRYKDARYTNHSFPGGRSEEMLKRAVKMNMDYQIAGNDVAVTVTIENLTGHSIPNG
jgi:formate-dependent nitrite reductase cytochrome c552 subunit